MLRVPHQHRGEQQQAEEQAQPGPGPEESPATVGADQQGEAERGRKEQHGVFAQQAEPEPQAGGEPVTTPVGFNRHRRMVAGRGPAGQEQTVRGGDEGRAVGEQEQFTDQAGVESDPPGKPAGREQAEESGGQGQTENGRQADRPLGVAEQGGRQSDGPGDHRRMVMITEGQVAAPLPVVGLIRGQKKLPADKDAPKQYKRYHPPGQGSVFFADALHGFLLQH